MPHPVLHAPAATHGERDVTGHGGDRFSLNADHCNPHQRRGQRQRGESQGKKQIQERQIPKLVHTQQVGGTCTEKPPRGGGGEETWKEIQSRGQMRGTEDPEKEREKKQEKP